MVASTTLSVDDLLLYSKCPMRYFFKAYIGMTSTITSVTQQVSEALRLSLVSYLSNYGSPAAYSVASRKLNDALSNVVFDTTVRGSQRKQKVAEASLSNAAAVLERCVREFELMSLTDVVSPYIYTMELSDGIDVIGSIDAIYKYNDRMHVLFIDTSMITHNEVSDDYLDNNPHITVNALAYEHSNAHGGYTLVHYFPYTNTMINVHRTPVQVHNMRHELLSIHAAVAMSVDKSAWYRSRGFWCGSCGIRRACGELFSAQRIQQ